MNVILYDGQLFLPGDLKYRKSKAVVLSFEEIATTYLSRLKETKLLVDWNNIEIQLCRMDSVKIDLFQTNNK